MSYSFYRLIQVHSQACASNDDMNIIELTEHIKQLELKLLHTNVQNDMSILEALLSSEFEEIDSNGNLATRQAAVEWLKSKDHAIRWQLEEFRIKILSDDLILAIYSAMKLDTVNSMGRGAIRTSIWRQQKDQWQMLFHQVSKRN